MKYFDDSILTAILVLLFFFTPNIVTSAYEIACKPGGTPCIAFALVFAVMTIFNAGYHYSIAKETEKRLSGR